MPRQQTAWMLLLLVRPQHMAEFPSDLATKPSCHVAAPLVHVPYRASRQLAGHAAQRVWHSTAPLVGVMKARQTWQPFEPDEQAQQQ